jgi:MscS family membrane protein
MNRTRIFTVFISLLLVLLGNTQYALALGRADKTVSSPAPSGSVAPVEEPVDAGSPRATIAAYFGLCRNGNYGDAAKYLDLPKERELQGPLLAKKLKAVLDRYVWVEPDLLSPIERGNTDDGLPLAYESIAKIPRAGGHTETVRLFKRVAPGDGPAWVFSRSTVSRIDVWYGQLEQRWVFEHFPQWLLRPGPKELLVWQWIAFPLFVLLGWAIGALLSGVSRKVLGKFASKTEAKWDDAVVDRLRAPMTLVWALGLLSVTVPLLGLYVPATEFIFSLIRGGFYFAAFWSVSRLIDVWGNLVVESPWALEHAAARAMVPIAVRLAKIIVLVFAVVALVSSLGYPAASLLAGLGVGGLAVALAAQKTLENLLGAFTIGFDQPFRVGDFVKIEEFLGHVESIGLRSTRIRTLDRTIITIPNGRLSEMRLESYAARDRIRFTSDLGLVYGTTREQLLTVLRGVGELFRTHPKIWPDDVVVRFKALGESALLVEIQAWFLTADFNEFRVIREELLLEILRIVESAGTEVAFPTQTVHVVPQKGPLVSHLG